MAFDACCEKDAKSQHAPITSKKVTHSFVPHTAQPTIRPRQLALCDGGTRVRLHPLARRRSFFPIDIHPLVLVLGALVLVDVHLRLLFLALPFPLRTSDLREPLGALLDAAGVEAGLGELGREFGNRPQAYCPREFRLVLHSLLAALRDKLVLARDLRLHSVPLIVGIKLSPHGQTNTTNECATMRTMSSSLS